MLSKETVYPSAKACLEQHIGCRQASGKGWALYWSEGGAELTFYPGGEGPQEMADIDEALDCIGGDQPVRLNPGTIKYLENLSEGERARILRAIEQPAKPETKRLSADTFKLKLVESAMAEDWCAALLWAKAAEDWSLDGDVGRLIEDERRKAQAGMVCWKCVDACNDIKQAMEG